MSIFIALSPNSRRRMSASRSIHEALTVPCGARRHASLTPRDVGHWNRVSPVRKDVSRAVGNGG
jgi:hypothetical protein